MDRDRGLGGEREKNCRMNEHAHSAFTASSSKYGRQKTGSNRKKDGQIVKCVLKEIKEVKRRETFRRC